MTELEKLVEKDAIRDQYYVYARALDRIDNPLGKTVFAEDAQVDYGPTYKGTGYGFIDMMLKMHRKMVSTHHVMTNILIKLNEDGTKAAAEAYMYAACKYRNGMVVVARCRDIDLWEKRDGKWLVVKRTVAGDNTMILHPTSRPTTTTAATRSRIRPTTTSRPSSNSMATRSIPFPDKVRDMVLEVITHVRRQEYTPGAAVPAPEDHRMQVLLLVVHGHEKKRSM